MSRATRYLRNVLLALALWALACANRALFLPEKYHTLCLAAPLIALVLFGAFSAVNILYHLATFKECPQAFVELQKEIVEAKMDLNRRGIKVN